jgi:hypothetical protein
VRVIFLTVTSVSLDTGGFRKDNMFKDPFKLKIWDLCWSLIASGKLSSLECDQMKKALEELGEYLRKAVKSEKED